MGKKASKRKSHRLAVPILGALLLLLGGLCYFSARWYAYYYGDIGFNSVLVTLLSGVAGVESVILFSFFCGVVGMTLTCTFLFTLWCCHRSRFHLRLHLFGRRFTISPVRPWVFLTACVLIFVLGIAQAAQIIGLPQWIANLGNASSLFDQEYVSCEDTEIIFPEQKRNLIYIYMESMETTFCSKEQGGSMESSVIPELYQLAMDNVSFSDADQMGGWGNLNGTTWTTAGMVAQAGGIPLLLPFKPNTADYMYADRPFASTSLLWDILKEQGYYQEVMMGSDKNFSDQINLMLSHGVDRICDWYSAMDDGIVPNGYKAWWGIEDSKLYAYARQELTRIAAQDQPFSFTLFTIDTHMPNGYLCPDCPNIFPEQYENVYACASAQVEAFVRWLQAQPFYENTTIIICGDHLSMDNGFFQRNMVDDSRRRVYNCIINGTAQAVNTKNRVFTPMDMFPTTLAAMGCQIQGDRLALGTNLYSDVPTLAEKMGIEALNRELERSTMPYLLRFLLEPEQSQWLLELMPSLAPQ